MIDALLATLLWTLVNNTGAMASIPYSHYGDGITQSQEENLCPSDQPPAAHTLILVDLTSPLSVSQRQRLRHLIETEAHRLTEDEQLTVLALGTTNPYKPEPLLSRCGRKYVHDVNALTGNAHFSHTAWAYDVGAPLDTALNRLMHTQNALTSPIVEVVKGLSMRQDFGPEIKHRRLVVFSDLLQTSSGWSQYGRGAARNNYEGFAATAFAVQLRLELTNVAVRIAYIEKSKTLHLQDHERRAFWLQFFRNAGAETRFWSEEQPSDTLHRGNDQTAPVTMVTNKAGTE